MKNQSIASSKLQLLADSAISQLNARVDIGLDGEFDTGDEEDPAAVARDFLGQSGLIDPANLPPASSAGPNATQEVAPTLTSTTTEILTSTPAISISAPLSPTDTISNTQVGQ